MITNEQLKKIYPNSEQVNRDKYLPHINRYMVEYGVNTYERVCAFLAQIGHESGQLRYAEEIWGPTKAQQGYEGKKDLGNTFKGDGKRFKGRGLIQVTGRANYTIASKDLGVDFVANPQLLSEPDFAVKSAFSFWNKNDLNKYATLKEEDFKTLTKKINGGLNGYADRINIWNRAKDVLK